MNSPLKTLLGVALLAAPLGLVAQTTTTTTTTRSFSSDPADWGPRAGDMELTLGGSGFTNKDIDNSSGGVSASFGSYLNDSLEAVVRQSVNYVNSDAGDASWAGSTRLALDMHVLPRGAIRPFIGINFGGVYGDDVNDTWVAGLEGGAKFYVKQQTFIFAMIDYGWAFDSADDADDTFDDGGFTWSVGIGFNF